MNLKVLNNLSFKDAKTIRDKYIGRAKGLCYINKEGRKYYGKNENAITMAIGILLKSAEFDYIKSEQILTYQNYE